MADTDSITAPASEMPLAFYELLKRIEAMLLVLVGRQTVKDWYSVEEFAQLVGKAEFTVREWCRLGRINAQKKGSGRGSYAAWAISHAELLRYQREGLLQRSHAVL
jgi:Helix-turn-helix domain